MKFSKYANRCFAGSIAASVLLAISAASIAFAAAADSSPVADDTLLVLLSNHTDRLKARTHLSNEAQVNTINDLHLDSEDYSILQVQGPQGQRETTLNKIVSMRKNHPEILSVSRNTIFHRLQGLGAPNDPDFSQQWPLAAMRWTAARSLYSTRQTRPATMTILSSGTHPVKTGSELGTYITQYNATGSRIVRESVQGSRLPGGAEGDVDSSITGALVDNGVLIAGSGNFVSSKPLYITMLRITSGNSVSLSTIYSAMVWAINNQKARGGAGPVSLSYGTDFSTAKGAAPLWANQTIQKLAGSLLNQGDIFVTSAGDNQGTWGVGTPAFPPGNAVVVQGTDANNNFYSTNTFTGGGLTLVLNDPAGAPGASQPAIINGVYATDYFGSSFSAPLWSSAIAMLISMNPSLTSRQADNILLNTGTQITGGFNGNAPWSAVVPAFDRAIQSAIGP